MQNNCGIKVLKEVFGIGYMGIGPSTLSLDVPLKVILIIQVGVNVLEKAPKVKAGPTVMTLVVEVLTLAIEVSTGFVLLDGRIPTEDAPTVPQEFALLLEKRKSGAKLFQIGDIDIQRQWVHSC